MYTNFSPQYALNQFQQFINPEFLKNHKDEVNDLCLSHRKINNQSHITCRKITNKTHTQEEIIGFKAARNFLWCAIFDGVHAPIAQEIFIEYKALFDSKSSKPLMLRDVLNIKHSVEKKRIQYFIKSFQAPFKLLNISFPKITENMVSQFEGNVAVNFDDTKTFLNFPPEKLFAYRLAFNVEFSNQLRQEFEKLLKLINRYENANEKEANIIELVLKNSNPYLKAVLAKCFIIHSYVQEKKIISLSGLDLFDYPKLFTRDQGLKNRIDIFKRDGCRAYDTMRILCLFHSILIETQSKRSLSTILNNTLKSSFPAYVANIDLKQDNESDAHLRCDYGWQEDELWGFKNSYLAEINAVIDNNKDGGSDFIVTKITNIINKCEKQKADNPIDPSVLKSIKECILDYKEKKEDSSLEMITTIIQNYENEKNVIPQPILKAIKIYEVAIRRNPENPWKHISQLLFTLATDEACQMEALGTDPVFFILVSLACYISNNLPIPVNLSHRSIKKLCNAKNVQFVLEKLSHETTVYSDWKYPEGTKPPTSLGEILKKMDTDFSLSITKQPSYPSWTALVIKITQAVLTSITHINNEIPAMFGLAKFLILTQLAKRLPENQLQSIEGHLKNLNPLAFQKEDQFLEFLTSHSLYADEELLGEFKETNISLDKNTLLSINKTNVLIIKEARKMLQSENHIIIVDPETFKFAVKKGDDETLTKKEKEKAIDLTYIAIMNTATSTEMYNLLDMLPAIDPYKESKYELSLKTFTGVTKASITNDEENDVYDFYRTLVQDNKKLDFNFLIDGNENTNLAIQYLKKHKKTIDLMQIHKGQGALSLAFGNNLLKFLDWLKAKNNTIEPAYISKDQTVVLNALQSLYQLKTEFENNNGTKRDIPFVLPDLFLHMPNLFSLELFAKGYLESQLIMLNNSLKPEESFQEYIKKHTQELLTAHRPMITMTKGSNLAIYYLDNPGAFNVSDSIILPPTDLENQEKFLTDFNKRYNTAFSLENLKHPKDKLFNKKFDENDFIRSKTILIKIAELFDKNLKSCKSDDEKLSLIIDTVRDILVWKVFPVSGAQVLPILQAFLCEHAKIQHFVIESLHYSNLDNNIVIDEIKTNGQKNLELFNKKFKATFESKNLFKNLDLWLKHINPNDEKKEPLLLKSNQTRDTRSFEEIMKQFETPPKNKSSQKNQKQVKNLTPIKEDLKIVTEVKEKEIIEDIKTEKQITKTIKPSVNNVQEIVLPNQNFFNEDTETGDFILVKKKTKSKRPFFPSRSKIKDTKSKPNLNLEKERVTLKSIDDSKIVTVNKDIVIEEDNLAPVKFVKKIEPLNESKLQVSKIEESKIETKQKHKKISINVKEMDKMLDKLWKKSDIDPDKFIQLNKLNPRIPRGPKMTSQRNVQQLSSDNLLLIEMLKGKSLSSEEKIMLKDITLRNYYANQNN